MDGVGGTLKHTVFKEVLRGQALVQNAFDFYTTAKALFNNIHVLFRLKEDMNERRFQFENSWNGVKSANGILAARRVMALGPHQLQLMRTSFDEILDPVLIILLL